MCFFITLLLLHGNIPCVVRIKKQTPFPPTEGPGGTRRDQEGPGGKEAKTLTLLRLPLTPVKVLGVEGSSLSPNKKKTKRKDKKKNLTKKNEKCCADKPSTNLFPLHPSGC